MLRFQCSADGVVQLRFHSGNAARTKFVLFRQESGGSLTKLGNDPDTDGLAVFADQPPPAEQFPFRDYLIEVTPIALDATTKVPIRIRAEQSGQTRTALDAPAPPTGDGYKLGDATSDQSVRYEFRLLFVL